MNQGQTNSPLAASSDDLQACHGTGQTCDAEKTWNAKRRTHILSNGLAIWDLGANVGEWIKDLPSYSDTETASYTLTGTDKDHFGTQGTYTSESGLGGIVTGNAGDLFRGGADPYSRSSLNSSPGIFLVSDEVRGSQVINNRMPGGKSNGVGFRCVYHP